MSQSSPAIPKSLNFRWKWLFSIELYSALPQILFSFIVVHWHTLMMKVIVLLNPLLYGTLWWWRSVHVTESAGNLPSSRVFSFSTTSVPATVAPGQRICWFCPNLPWTLTYLWFHFILIIQTWWGGRPRSLSRDQSHKSNSYTFKKGKNEFHPKSI